MGVEAVAHAFQLRGEDAELGFTGAAGAFEGGQGFADLVEQQDGMRGRLGQAGPCEFVRGCLVAFGAGLGADVETGEVELAGGGELLKGFEQGGIGVGGQLGDAGAGVFEALGDFRGLGEVAGQRVFAPRGAGC